MLTCMLQVGQPAKAFQTGLRTQPCFIPKGNELSRSVDLIWI